MIHNKVLKNVNIKLNNLNSIWPSKNKNEIKK